MLCLQVTILTICIEYNTECTVTEGGTIAPASKMFGEIVEYPYGDVTTKC